MASHAATAGPPPGTFVALWRRHDTRRTEQLARLKSLELQAGDGYGQQAWKQARLLWQNLPEGMRIDLPSPRAFGRVLGVFRTCATLKQNRISALELSAADIAALVDYSKSTVEAVLRWLGSETIEYEGAQVSRGLGVLDRVRRKGPALVDGALRFVYRTSRIVLTIVGRALLGLAAMVAEDPHRPRVVLSAAIHLEGPSDESASIPDRAVSRSWIDRIRSSLG